MKKISEHRIEQYLRYSYELSEEEKREVEHALRNSTEARTIYDFLKEFYAELDGFSGVQKNIIPLHIATFNENESGPVVLAAMTPKTFSHSLITKATLVSEEHKTLVRVLEDQHNHSLQFHILSGRSKQVERAILSLVNPDVDLVADENGKLKNVRELSGIHWDSVSTLLRLPVSKTTISLDRNKNLPHSLKNVLDSEILLSQKNGKLVINVANQESKLSRVLLVQGRQVSLQRFEECKAEIELSGSDDVTLYFYE